MLVIDLHFVHVVVSFMIMVTMQCHIDRRRSFSVMTRRIYVLTTN